MTPQFIIKTYWVEIGFAVLWGVLALGWGWRLHQSLDPRTQTRGSLLCAFSLCCGLCLVHPVYHLWIRPGSVGHEPWERLLQAVTIGYPAVVAPLISRQRRKQPGEAQAEPENARVWPPAPRPPSAP